MMKFNKIRMGVKSVILLLAISALFLLGLFILRSTSKVNKSPSLKISLNKSEYKIGDNLKVMFANLSSKNMCFSSFYPYLMQKAQVDGLKHKYNWKTYSYPKTNQKDIVKDCFKPQETKTFLIKLDNVYQEGTYRLSIPICFGCKKGDLFRDDQNFHSEKFKIE